MRGITLLVVIIVLATTISCDRVGSNANSGVCASTNVEHVCTVPFEAVYSQRETLFNRSIRLDGVVVVGVRPEPPGSKTPVILLFPSIERARICNSKLAIELVPFSKEIDNALKNANGEFVSVAGLLRQSSKGNWSQMEVTTLPALISSEKYDFQCMTSAPPPLTPGS